MYAGIAVAAVAGTVAYNMWSSPEPLPIRADPANRSRIMPDGSRQSAIAGDPYDKEEYLFDKVETLYEAFRRGHRIAKDLKCLGERTGPNKGYEWMTYDQVLNRSENFSSGLIHMGLKPKDNFGIFSINNSKWVIAEQACNVQSLVVTPLYDTFGTDACQYIINLTEMSTIVCDTEDRISKLLKNISNLPSLKTIISMTEISEETKAEAASNNISVYLFEDVETLGVNNPHTAEPPKPSDIATICFTSGTTGTPKGAMLTHGNMVCNASVISTKDYFDGPLDPDVCHFSYLPLAHMYERTVHVMMFLHGCHIGFFRGDVKLMLDDIQALKPTMFAAVPRVLNKVYDKVMNGVKGSKIKSFLLKTAINQKYKEIERGIIRKNSFWDKLLLWKVQAVLGGNVRVITTGSAPLSIEVLRFTRAAFGCLVLEGYGQTECSAAVTFQHAGDSETGHVGAPVACNSVKLADVAEMEYFAKDNKGEILVKGTNVFKGYYKKPDITAEVFDSEGWLRTGDIGMWLPNGALKIIDRKKNIYKLAQGEYIAPEKVENIYCRSAYVAQAFVDGDSLKHASMAVLVPEPETLLPWAKRKGLAEDVKTLCSHPEVKTLIFEDILQQGRTSGLSSLEQAKDIYLSPDPFTVDNGLTTPTFKNVRAVLRKHFAKEFEQLYAGIQ